MPRVCTTRPPPHMRQLSLHSHPARSRIAVTISLNVLYGVDICEVKQLHEVCVKGDIKE